MRWRAAGGRPAHTGLCPTPFFGYDSAFCLLTHLSLCPVLPWTALLDAMECLLSIVVQHAVMARLAWPRYVGVFSSAPFSP